MTDPISGVAKVVGEGLEIVADTLERKNAADVKEAEKAQNEADAVAEETCAVEEKDTEEIRRNIAE
jgi:F0F1-type ATP synthase epsilon subunit